MSLTTGHHAPADARRPGHAQGEAPVAVDPGRHATSWLWQDGDDPGREILRQWDDGAWQGLTRSQLAARVLSVAAGLVAAGVAPGDRVVLMSRTRWSGRWPTWPSSPPGR